MENSTQETTLNRSSVQYGYTNQLVVSNVTHQCYPWVAGEFIDRNFTLEEVNSVVMRRNLAGIVVLGIIMILGVVGNAHVLFVFCKRKYRSHYIHDRIHVNYRIFVLWLSTLSIIICAVVSPLLIVYLIHPVNYPSDALCKIFRFLLYFVPVTISLTLVAIAVDRYLVICRTFENKLTSKHSKRMCVGTVVVALILTWPAPVVFSNVNTETGIPGFSGIRCYLEDESMTFQQYYQDLLVVFFFAVMIVLSVLYTLVMRDYRKLLQFRRTTRRYAAATPRIVRSTHARQEFQKLCLYVSVTISYIVSALPYHILALLLFGKVIVECTLSLNEAEWFYVFIWSYFFSPVINPILYGFQDDGFRQTIQVVYKRLLDSIKKCLFVHNYSDDENTTHNTSEISTENTDDTEIQEVDASIAAITIDVTENIMQDDINTLYVHI